MTERQLETKNGVEAGTVSFTARHTADGYLARPTNHETPFPGVILIQEWWGIEPHIQELTERLAREGFVVLAPDLFHGVVVQEPDDAEKAAMALNIGQALDEISAAIDYLQARDDVQPKRVGVVGFCMGGTLAWNVAERENGDIGAVAPFYAFGYEPTAEDIQRVTAPALVIWGGADDSIPPEQREHIVTLLEQRGLPHKAIVYEGAGHAFLNDTHDDHNPEAASQAWEELLAFFQAYLPG